MIEVKNLVKKYGQHVAVNHLSFSLEPGKIYGLLGPNGAGKSTTMNMMTGYLGATEGEVIINGHDILKEPEKAKKNIGYLPEMPPLYMDMLVREYLEFAAELKEIPKDKRDGEIERVMKMTQLVDVQDRLIHNLSKGYRQRVGLAQALLGFPEILILDEPTVGLDPKQIMEIRELIRSLAKDHTVILSSHILAEIRETCDYIMIISKGELVASDTPERLEERMAGEETLALTVKAKAEKVKEILGKVSGICEVEFVTPKKAEKPDGTDADNGTDVDDGKAASAEYTELIITAEPGKDIREALFYAFAERRAAIVEMQTRKASLEEVFLELTGSEKGGEEA